MVTEATVESKNPVLDAPVDQVVPEGASSIGIGPLEDFSVEAEGTGTTAPVVAEAPPALPRPPMSPSPERMQQELQQMQAARASELWAREQQVRQQEDAQTLQQYQSQLAAQIEQKYGLAPEQAAELAERQVQVIYQGYQQQIASEGRVQESQAKVQVATIISQQYGVPIASLMRYNTPWEMQAAGERMKSDGALRSEVEQLRAQVAKLTKGSVPAQSFSTGAVGAGSAGLNEQALEKAVALGTVAMTPEISARLNKYWNQ